MPCGTTTQRHYCAAVCVMKKQPYLTLVRVEVLWFLLLVVWNTFQRCTIVPIAPVVITQDAENAVSLYCSMTTHHQPALSWVVALLC